MQLIRISGFCTIYELEEYLINQNSQLSPRELYVLLQAVDSDGDGELNEDEFVSACLEFSAPLSEVMLSKWYSNNIFTSLSSCDVHTEADSDLRRHLQFR